MIARNQLTQMCDINNIAHLVVLCISLRHSIKLSQFFDAINEANILYIDKHISLHVMY